MNIAVKKQRRGSRDSSSCVIVSDHMVEMIGCDLRRSDGCTRGQEVRTQCLTGAQGNLVIRSYHLTAAIVVANGRQCLTCQSQDCEGDGVLHIASSWEV